MKTKLFFLSLLTTVLFSTSTMAALTMTIDEINSGDYNWLSNQMTPFLNSWCPDAWCSGDYDHHFGNFIYDDISREWILEIVSLPRFITEVPGWASHIQNKVAIRRIQSTIAQCSFYAPDPRELFQLVWRAGNSSPEMRGISDRMSDELSECTRSIEKFQGDF